MKANIKYYRVQAGLTQKQLSERSGIAEPTIRRYESGKLNPKYETLQKIAEALNVTVFDLTTSERTVESVGERIRNARKRAKLSQQQLAESLGVHVNTVRRWENGERTPKLKIVRTMADIFNVPTEYFYKEEPEIGSEKENVSAMEFHEAMKAHCIKSNRNCEACCMRLYCYTPPCEKTESMVTNVIAFLENQHIHSGSDNHSDRHNESDSMPCPCSMDMSTAIGYEPR